MVANRFIKQSEEATRTPDPYVPNVVRYQLRYFPFPESRLRSPSGYTRFDVAKISIPTDSQKKSLYFFVITSSEIFGLSRIIGDQQHLSASAETLNGGRHHDFHVRGLARFAKLFSTKPRKFRDCKPAAY